MNIVECFTIRTFLNRKQLNRFRKLASRHQLGSGCEAVAVTLAHALGEGSGISSIILGFPSNDTGIRIWLLTVFNSGFSENHRLKSPIIAWAPILSNLGTYRSNSAGHLALHLAAVQGCYDPRPLALVLIPRLRLLLSRFVSRSSFSEAVTRMHLREGKILGGNQGSEPEGREPYYRSESELDTD